MGQAKWSAADYAANSAVQQNWARELIARLRLGGDERVLDAGCGDGKVTAEIAQAVPRGGVTGIDASPEMIAFAKKTFSPRRFPNLRFQLMDARRIRFRRSFDVVFSNAALHWVDDHPAFLRGAASVLKDGGRLMVSCGGRGNAQDVFDALRPEMRLKRRRPFFRGMPMPYFFHAPGDYEKWLPATGFKTFKVRLAPRDAIYGDADAFKAWLRTTWLPYVQRVPEESREEFIAAITKSYLAKHPPGARGDIHVRMVRLEMEARVEGKAAL
ncbi:MAG: methyltransferase domain-containing protein [Verrucomicrobia bacterium]|nr:methyltransferase domain-containing protein [Verrucomicrobiota bacterium]MDE3099447.1 methyltransferase domain-containing protein [Verrucomicrobiota bacterium]